VIAKSVYNVPHKVNPGGKYSFKFVNGAWITSTRLNIDIIDTPLGLGLAPVQDNRRRVLGKSTSVSFCEAKDAHDRMNTEGTKLAVEARRLGVDKYTLERAVDLYEGGGQAAFTRYN
jgi:hypothetical protein